MKIFCDESGHTGANLLDRTQPYFVFASNNFDNETTKRFLDIVKTEQATEAKFKNLKKSSPGRKKLITLFKDKDFCDKHLFLTIYEKEFYVIAKLVDLVLEPILHRWNRDIYRGKTNVAISNFLYASLKNRNDSFPFLESFVNLVNSADINLWEQFAETGNKLLKSTTDRNLKEILEIIIEKNNCNIWFNEDEGKNSLEPSIAAICDIAINWYCKEEKELEIICDKSKPLNKAKEALFDKLNEIKRKSDIITVNDKNIPISLIFKFLKEVRFEDSTDSPQIQLADLCAGFVNHCYKNKLNNQKDELSKLVGELDWKIHTIFFENKFNSSQLGVNEYDDFNIVDKIMA